MRKQLMNAIYVLSLSEAVNLEYVVPTLEECYYLNDLGVTLFFDKHGIVCMR